MANLSGANLFGANLRAANLYAANLYGADLYGANLFGVRNATLAIARLQHIPEEGSFVGWKKCRNEVLVKLLIPADAKRSHGTERKCRASHVDVLEVIGAEVGVSIYDFKTEYRVGQRITANGWDEDRWNTCSQGIHFYFTRAEAEAHSL